MPLPGCRALSRQVEGQGGARLLGASPVMPFFWMTRTVSDLYLALRSFCRVVTSCARAGAAAQKKPAARMTAKNGDAVLTFRFMLDLLSLDEFIVADSAARLRACHVR